MNELYAKITALCEERGISRFQMCKDTGISPGTLTDLKMGRQTGISVPKAQKIADYFAISVDELTGRTEDEIDPEERLKFALFGGEGEITDEMYEEVKEFARFVKEREMKKKRGV